MKRLSIDLDSLSIFWEEDAAYIFVYAAYALIICGIILYLESRFQKSDVDLYKLIASNISTMFLAVVLFSLSMFIMGWHDELLGGGVPAFFITLFISFVILYASKILLINYFEIQLESPHVKSVILSLSLLAPFVAFNLFLFIQASADWRH